MNDNLTLLTDFYELTMMQGYFETNKNETVIFDVFYRKNPSEGGYAVCCGLQQVIEYIKELHFTEEDIEYLKGQQIFNEAFLQYLRDFKFTGDIYAIKEGTVDFLIDQNGFFQGYRPLYILTNMLVKHVMPEAEYLFTEINIKTKYNL